MSVARRALALLLVAREDVAATRLLANAGNRNAIYLCQQAAEKLIRARLAQRGVDATREHHLRVLVDLLPGDDPWRTRLAPLDRLSPFATTYRYPTPGGRVPESPPADVVLTEAAAIEALIADLEREFDPRP